MEKQRNDFDAVSRENQVVSPLLHLPVIGLAPVGGGLGDEAIFLVRMASSFGWLTTWGKRQEIRSLSFLALHPDVSVMRIGNLLRYRKPEAASFGS